MVWCHISQTLPTIDLWTRVGTLLNLTSTKLIDCCQLCESNLHIYPSWIADKKIMFLYILKISQNIFLKEDVFVKENETSFGIFQIILFVEMWIFKIKQLFNKTPTNSLFNYNNCICMYIYCWVCPLCSSHVDWHIWYNLDHKI
jgi:hypothetical protein